MGYFYRGKHSKPNKYYIQILDFMKFLQYKIKRLKKRIRIFLIKFERKTIYAIDRFNEFYDRILN